MFLAGTSNLPPLVTRLVTRAWQADRSARLGSVGARSNSGPSRQAKHFALRLCVRESFSKGGDSVIFDPATASVSGAAFAALLAAIALSVLGQLALSGDSKPDRHKFEKSLSVGLLVLALLLSTTYMFVLMSGLTAEPPHGAFTKAYEATALLRGSAFLFIICGSALAVSAAAVILVVGLVVSESGTTSERVRDAVNGTLAGGVIADGIFLGYGYNDIASAFGWHPFAWTSAATVALAVPIVWSILRLPPNLLGKMHFARDHWSKAFFASFIWLVIMPIVFFRIWFRHGFAGSTPYGSAIGPLLFTVACALWAGVSLAGCILISQSSIRSLPGINNPEESSVTLSVLSLLKRSFSVSRKRIVPLSRNSPRGIVRLATRSDRSDP